MKCFHHWVFKQYFIDKNDPIKNVLESCFPVSLCSLHKTLILSPERNIVWIISWTFFLLGDEIFSILHFLLAQFRGMSTSNLNLKDLKQSQNPIIISNRCQNPDSLHNRQNDKKITQNVEVNEATKSSNFKTYSPRDNRSRDFNCSESKIYAASNLSGNYY